MTETQVASAVPPAPRRRFSGSRWAAVLKTPMGATAGTLLLVVLLLALFGPMLWIDEATKVDVTRILEGGSSDHWVGTDNLGRDIFYRVLVAARLSIGLALLATVIAVALGLVLGTAPLVVGRRTGKLITAGVNIAVAFPGLLLALFFAVIFGIGKTGAVLAIGLAGAPSFARLTQTLAAGIAERDFVAAARIAGVGRIRLMGRHILPNIGEPLVVNATIGAGGALLAFAGLSFLGLGVQAPDYDWGRLLQDGLAGIYIHPEAALAPGVAIVVTGLAFNLFGESVAKGLGLTTTLGSLPLGVRAKVTTPNAPNAASPAAPLQGELVLDVQNLSVRYPSPAGAVRPVRDVTFSMRRGEAIGVVGESGSGKSLTALAIAKLIEQPGEVTADTLRFLGTDLLRDLDSAGRSELGNRFGMVFQDPMTSFNPTKRIGTQLAELAREHQGLSKKHAITRAVDRLREVRVPAAERRARQYPHEFSGGMRQRAMIGMGLMGDPALIVADEPTTALDVTVQHQVLDLLAAIRAEGEVALLFISHDVAVVRQVCDRVMVMYAGRVVEDLPVAELARGGRHPYTRALVATVPDMHVDLDAPLQVIPGRPVDPASQPVGCAYAPRCPLADDHCRAVDPDLVSDTAGRRVACWHAGEPIPAGRLTQAATVDATEPRFDESPPRPAKKAPRTATRKPQ